MKRRRIWQAARHPAGNWGSGASLDLREGARGRADCIVPNPDFNETPEELMAKYESLHG